MFRAANAGDEIGALELLADLDDEAWLDDGSLPRPSTHAVLMRQAQAHARHGDPSSALAAIDNVVRLLRASPPPPDLAWAPIDLFHACTATALEAGRHDRAASLVAARPATDPLALLYRAEIAFESSRLDEADRLLCEAMSRLVSATASAQPGRSASGSLAKRRAVATRTRVVDRSVSALFPPAVLVAAIHNNRGVIAACRAAAAARADPTSHETGGATVVNGSHTDEALNSFFLAARANPKGSVTMMVVVVVIAASSKPQKITVPNCRHLPFENTCAQIRFRPSTTRWSWPALWGQPRARLRYQTGSSTRRWTAPPRPPITATKPAAWSEPLIRPAPTTEASCRWCEGG